MKKLLFSTIVILATTIEAFSQNVNYEIFALKYADIGVPFPLSAFALDAPESETIDAVFMFWLLKGTDGKNIMVDAGFLQGIEEGKAFSVKNYTRPDLMLPRIGLTAEDITDIILTHPHWDHMDGIDLFPNANVWIQEKDYNYFVGKAWQKDSKSGGFNKRDVRKLVELNLSKKLTLIDGDEKEIFPNIKVYTGSRHTYDSQFILVNNGTNKIVLASDNAYIYYNLEHLTSAPKNATFDINAYVKSMERMNSLASDTKFIIPGHDALLLTKFPKVAKDIIRID